MKPSARKAKGRQLQNFVRDRLLETFPDLEKDDIKSTIMGAQGEDIQLSPAARKLIPFNIECKNRAAIAIYNDYKQANAHGKHNPLLVIKQNHSKPLAVLDFDLFLALLKA